MSLPQAAADFYRGQQAITAAVIGNVRRIWRSVGVDLDAGWDRVGSSIATVVSAGQSAAAAQSDGYVVAVLAETQQINEPVGRLVPRAFATVAGDGRPTATLLEGAVVASKRSMADGMPLRQALEVGGRWLDMAAQTAIADASRGATNVAIAVRPAIGGYVRMVNPPACSRCILLAGKFFAWNAGFARHPRCDCRHIPASENVAGDFTTSPSAYFASLGPDEQDRIFTAAGARAIRDGADISQVVNARRGMYTAPQGMSATYSGTARRSAFARRQMVANGDTVRLMPEAIYEIAADRTQAIELLARAGFVVR
jgi:hypothetical protein